MRTFLIPFISLSISFFNDIATAFSFHQHHPKANTLMEAAARRQTLPTSLLSSSNDYNEPLVMTTRTNFLQQVITATTITTASVLSRSQSANASTSLEQDNSNKQNNLSNEEIAQIVKYDMTESSFLTNGKLTRSIYDEKATFTDEIDTYSLPQWIKGTSQLFVPPPKGSRVGLVGDVVATKEKVEFRFEEDLMFNIPFKPIVFVSGKVVLDRDLDSGLITSYREFWDQDVKTVLKSARFK